MVHDAVQSIQIPPDSDDCCTEVAVPSVHTYSELYSRQTEDVLGPRPPSRMSVCLTVRHQAKGLVLDHGEIMALRSEDPEPDDGEACVWRPFRDGQCHQRHGHAPLITLVLVFLLGHKRELDTVPVSESALLPRCLGNPVSPASPVSPVFKCEGQLREHNRGLIRPGPQGISHSIWLPRFCVLSSTGQEAIPCKKVWKTEGWARSRVRDHVDSPGPWILFPCLQDVAALAPCNCKFVQRDTSRRLNPFLLLFESWHREVRSVKEAHVVPKCGVIKLCADVNNKTCGCSVGFRLKFGKFIKL